MSSLNNSAIDELLQEKDILSSPDRLQSIWSQYTNTYYVDKDRDIIMDMIINSIKTNIIDDLHYGDHALDDKLKVIYKLAIRMVKEFDTNSVVAFILSLAQALQWNGKNSTMNIKINMDKCNADISIQEKIKMLSCFEQCGFLDSDQIQRLIDDENSDLTAICTNIRDNIRDWKTPNGEKPVRDVNTQLKLEDFIPNLDEIETRISRLLIENGDALPDSPLDMIKLVSPSGNISKDRLFHPNNFLPNIASLRVIAATIGYIGSIIELDSRTAMYTLYSLHEKLKTLLQYFGSVPCFVYSQLIVTAVLIKYLKTENRTALNGNRGCLTEDYIRNVGKIELLKKELQTLLDILKSKQFADFDGNTILKDSTIEDYLDYVDIASLEELPVKVSKKSQSSDDAFELPEGELKEEFQELFNGLKSIYDEFNKVTDVFDKIGSIGTTESNLSILDIASSNGNNTHKNDYLSIIETATKIHDEFNRSLLNSDMESAADNLSKEMILEQTITEILTKELSNTESLIPIRNILNSDIYTYTGLLESTVQGGLSKYKDSAKSFIEKTLKSE